MNKELKLYVNQKFNERVDALKIEKRTLINKMFDEKKNKITAEKEEKRLVISGLIKRILEISKDDNLDVNYRINYLKNIKVNDIFSIQLTGKEQDEIYNNKKVLEIDKKIEDLKKTNELVILRLSLEKKFENINEILKEYGMEL